LKKDSKYIIMLSAVMIAFVLFQLFSPEPIDWTPTYLASDKNPFGAYVTDSLLGSFFDKKKVINTNLTLYELKDSIGTNENIISISNTFDPDRASTQTLLNKVAQGSHAFISAFSFSGKFQDTLKLNTPDVYFSGLAKPGEGTRDTSDLKFVIPQTPKKGYYYRLENISNFFSMLDSMKSDAYSISTNAWGKTVTLRIPWGKGYFILNTTPLVFTNNYLLYEDNSTYAAITLSYLPPVKTWWTAYYQVGRLEAQTPLRFVLSHEPLRWAYWITIFNLLLFVGVEAKRKQRIIPVIRPLTNTTLEFVKTIGNMYLHARDHKSIAEKKILFFIDQVRSSYFMSNEINDQWVETLAKKSGNSMEQTQKLFILIKLIQHSVTISQPMLMELNLQLEYFSKSKP
jgi:hypothetical protein